MVDQNDVIDLSNLGKNKLGYQQILLWHIDRISKATGFDILLAAPPNMRIDEDKIFRNQVSLLHYALKPYWDDQYKKDYNKIMAKGSNSDEDDSDRFFYETWYGYLMELMSRLGMLLEENLTEEI